MKRKTKNFDWIKPKYSRKEINWAGRVVSGKKKVSEDEEQKAIFILENWRASHSYPLHIFQIRLKKYCEKIDKSSIVAQRLKRAPAIIYKLTRGYSGHKPSMDLYQMQDIGGCRAVLSNVKLAKKLYEEKFLKGDLKHKRTNQKDYLINPKSDGYRGIHLVYDYFSDGGRKEYDGLKVEVQIRSKLQHLWATAVETIDFITQQAIKFGGGEPEWNEFFLLVSSAFSHIEGYSYFEATPQEEKELYLKIKEKERELNAIEKMKAFTTAFKDYTENKKIKKAKFFLLELIINDKRLIITEYGEKEKERAIKEYGEKEKEHKGDRQYDVVLVSVDGVKELKKAYPNYFANTNDFIIELEKIINKY